MQKFQEYTITIQMDNISILKELDQNRSTKQTNSEQHKWVNRADLPKLKAQFKGIQIQVLNIFTLAKSELSAHYQRIVGRIKRIQKYLYSQSARVRPAFWGMMEEIQQEIQEKIADLGINLQAAVVTAFLFDQLISFMPDTCTAQTPLSSSQKKIHNSSLSSGNRLTQKNINQTIADLDNITNNEYRTALKIKPNEKRIDNLGCLSGKWDVLQEINLENKKISLMVPLSTVIAETLQEINFSCNQIRGLECFRDAEYPILRVLNLNKNLITNLQGLQTASLPNLKILNLSENKLKKLSPLEDCHFQYLIQLNLSQNRLQKPQTLIHCNFPKLEILNLDHNAIQNLEFILSCTFYRLKILSFCYNELRSIDCLKKCKLQKLEALLGYNNRIQSISFLEFCDFPQLREIILNNNMIEDIQVVEKMKFKNLAEFDLENNNLKPKEVMCFVIKNQQCKRAKKKYPFIQL